MSMLPARLLLSCLALAAVSVFAVDRTLTVTAPVEAGAGETVHVTLTARTAGDGGEKIGFLHAEYSTDGGTTWTSFCYEQDAGPVSNRTADFKVGAAGTKTIMRARAAFRGGRAGDVDFKGAPIQWDGSWAKWQTPPAQFAIVYVK